MGHFSFFFFWSFCDHDTLVLGWDQPGALVLSIIISLRNKSKGLVRQRRRSPIQNFHHLSHKAIMMVAVVVVVTSGATTYSSAAVAVDIHGLGAVGGR